MAVRLGNCSAWIVNGLAALALWSWIAGVENLFAFTSDHLPMAPSAALCLGLIGTTILLRGRLPAGRAVAWIGNGLVASSALFGMFAGIRPLFGWNSGIEEWLSHTLDRGGNIPIGQMSPLTGALLLIAATAYGLQSDSLSRHPVWRRMSAALAGIISFAGLGVASSYALAQPWLYGSSVIPIALWTALAFVFLGGALLGASAHSRGQFGSVELHSNPIRDDRNAVPVAVGASLAVMISFLSALYLRHERIQDGNDAREKLEAIGRLKLNQINSWRQERLNDARFFAQADFVSRDVFMFLEHPLSGQARERLLHWLNLLKAGKRYSSVAVFDTNAVMRLATMDQTNSKLILPRGLMADVIQLDQVVMSDLKRSEDNPQVHLDIAFPVHAPGSGSNLASSVTSEIVGVVLLRLDPREFLYPLIQSWPTPSRTAETELFRREGSQVVFLNDLRHRTNSALNVRFPIDPASSHPAVKAALGQVGQMEGRDYRGIPVLANVRRVPETSWYLVAKMDTDEIYGELNEHSWMILALTAALALAGGLFVEFAFKRKEAQQALSELAAERQRLALAQRVGHLMKHANDAIILADEKNRILEANDRALELYSFSSQEFQAMTLVDLRPETERDDFERQDGQVISAGRAIYETLQRRKDGSVFPAEVSGSFIKIGDADYKLGFIRDITQRKAHEREIERMTRLYATLSQVNHSITRVRSTKELFDEVCRIAVEFGGFKGVWVGWLDDVTKAVKVVAQAGESNGYLDNIKVSAEDTPHGRGPIGLSLREGKTCVINDFIHDERAMPWREAAAAHGLLSVAAMPIRASGKVCGAFTVYADGINVFQDKEIALLEEMAMDISFALDHLAQEESKGRAEAALRESENKLRTLVENIPQKIFIKDLSSRYVFINGNYARDLGIQPDEVAGKLDYEFFPKDLAEEYRAADRRVMATGRTEQFEERYVESGSEVWIHTIKTPMRNENGAVVGVCGIFHDITERKKSDAALIASEEQFRAMFELASIGMAQADPLTGRFLRVNEKFSRIVGYSIEEMLGMRFPEITHPDDRKRDWESFQRVMSGEAAEYRGEKRYFHKDGGIVWVNVNVTIVRDATGKPARSMATIEDITERKHTEALLRQSEERHRILFENSHDAIVVVAALDFKFTQASPAALKMFCIGSEVEFCALGPADVSPQFQPDGRLSADEVHEKIRTCLRDGACSFEWLHRRLSGEEFPALVTLTRTDVGGETVVLSTVRDITEHKRTEQELRHRLELQNQLARVSATVPGMVYSFRLRPDGSLSMPYVSESIERVFGLKPEQVREDATPAMSMIHPDDIGRVIETIKASAQTMIPWQAEFRIRNTRKGEIWAEGHSVPELEPDGSVLWHGFIHDVTKRKRSEAELSESRERLRCISDNLPHCMLYQVQIDADGTRRFTYVSDTVRRLHGCSPEEAVADANRIYGSICEEDQQLAAEKEKEATAAMRIFSVELRVRNPDGTVRWSQLVSTPRRLANGSILWDGIEIDVTERRNSDAALQESEERLKLALGASQMGVWEWDLQTDAVYWSPECYDIVGLEGTDAALKLEHFTSLVHPEDRAFVVDVAKQAIASKTRFHAEFRLVRPDGGLRWLADDARASYDSDGKPVRMVGTVQDITARKLAEDEVRKFSRAVEQSSTAIVITNPSGKIEYVNPKFTEISGYTLDEVRGQNPRILKSGQTSAEEYRNLWSTIRKGREWRGEFQNKKKNGELFWEAASISPIMDASGRITHFVAVKEDITARRLLEAQYRQAQKMEAIGQLAGGVAHDFNNILAAIMMQADLAAEGTNPPETQEMLHEIKVASERAANLTRQLLAFSRRQVMQPRRLDLNDIVTSLSKMLQRIVGEDVRLQLNLHPHALTTYADAGMLDQVLMNLVVNARDAMPSGGRLFIETGEKIFTETEVALTPDVSPGRHVLLRVTDTGSGIAPENLSRIFEPFFTTKEPGKGTGLGLATVFGIVKQHGGSLMVESQVGKGTTFQILLPASKDVAELPRETRRKIRPEGGTETILLVEDEPAVRRLTRVMLERYGYHVLEAPDGVSALQIWEQHRESIHLLFTDMVMPEGMSGRELSTHLQKRNPRLKVIFTSGYSAEFAGRELDLQEGQTFIQKPSPPQQLLELVRKCLDS